MSEKNAKKRTLDDVGEKAQKKEKRRKREKVDGGGWVKRKLPTFNERSGQPSAPKVKRNTDKYNKNKHKKFEVDNNNNNTTSNNNTDDNINNTTTSYQQEEIQKKRKVALGGVKFMANDAVVLHAREILHSNYGRLEKMQERFVVDLLINGHPNYKQKIGDGIDHIKVPSSFPYSLLPPLLFLSPCFPLSSSNYV